MGPFPSLQLCRASPDPSAAGRRHRRGGARPPLPARNLSSPSPADSGSRGSCGPEVKAVGGVGGALGRDVRGGLQASEGPSVVTRVPLSGPGGAVRGWTVRCSSEANAARTERSRLGPWPPAQASTSRTPRSTCGTSLSWTGPLWVSRDSEGGPSASGQKGSAGLGRVQGLVPQDQLCILVGEGRSGKSLSVLHKEHRPRGTLFLHPRARPFCFVLQSLG